MHFGTSFPLLPLERVTTKFCNTILKYFARSSLSSSAENVALRVGLIYRIVAIERLSLSITAGEHLKFACAKARPCAFGYQLHTVQFGLTPNVLTPLRGDESHWSHQKKRTRARVYSIGNRKNKIFIGIHLWASQNKEVESKTLDFFVSTCIQFKTMLYSIYFFAISAKRSLMERLIFLKLFNE